MEDQSIYEKTASQLKRGITFVCVEEENIIKEIGTGVFCQVFLEDYLTHETSYFVTAKHVLESGDGLYEKIFLRLNTKERRSEYLEVSVKDQVILHHENTVA